MLQWSSREVQLRDNECSQTLFEGPQKDWDEYVQLLAGAIRSTYNKSTGFSPNMMMLGREVIQPVDLMLGTSQMNMVPQEPNEYVQKLGKILEDVHHIARDNIHGAQMRQKRDYTN